MTEAADCDSIANCRLKLESEELVTRSKNTVSISSLPCLFSEKSLPAVTSISFAFTLP